METVDLKIYIDFINYIKDNKILLYNCEIMEIINDNHDVIVFNYDDNVEEEMSLRGIDEQNISFKLNSEFGRIYTKWRRSQKLNNIDG
jgi:hypothetical protein